MTLTSRCYVLATALVAMPLVGALAQTNPSGNYGSNNSVTAEPGTADDKAASGMNTADANSRKPGMSSSAGGNYTPGSTGRTVVPGSNSSVGSTASNSAAAKSGGGGNGGGNGQ